MSKFCTNCGKEIEDGVKFCPFCGKTSNRTVPPEQEQAERTVPPEQEKAREHSPQDLFLAPTFFRSCAMFWIWPSMFSPLLSCSGSGTLLP